MPHADSRPDLPIAGRPYQSLFCSPYWPRSPGHFGGEIRDFHLLWRLLTISTVEFFAVQRVASDGREDRLAPRVERLHTPETIARTRPELVRPGAADRTRTRRLIRELQHRGLPVLGARFHWDVASHLPSIERYCRSVLQESLERQCPDFLFVSPQTNPIALMLDTETLSTRLVMASYDVEALRVGSFAESARGIGKLALWLESRRAARFERENLAWYDGVIAVSEEEKREFVERYAFAPHRVLVIENGVDPQYFAFGRRMPGARPHVVFVGTLSYPANRQAAWRLLRQVMPLVRRQHAEVCLWIVGQHPGPALQAESDGYRTIVTGAVADVRPYLARASVACIPLCAGGGTKYKVLEALSAGVPTVCSPQAVAGLALRDGRHVLVRDGDDALASGIVQLIDDPQMAARLAEQGRAAVERRYAWETNLPRLDTWLAMLSTLPRRRAEVESRLPRAT